MDWPDADGNGAHLDKLFLDDCRKCRWEVLAERYGWASITWFLSVWAEFRERGGDDE